MQPWDKNRVMDGWHGNRDDIPIVSLLDFNWSDDPDQPVATALGSNGWFVYIVDPHGVMATMRDPEYIKYLQQNGVDDD